MNERSKGPTGPGHQSSQAIHAGRHPVGYDFLLSATQTVCWKMDWPTRCFTAMDSTVEEVLGYPQAYWQDLDCWARTIHEEDRARTLAFLEAQTAAGRNHQFEYREIDPEGQTRWVRQIVTVVSGVEGAERLVGFSQDITSIKRADETVRSSEAKLLQAQKMEAMGQLAGGVAHDFNNILVATMMQLGLLRHHPSLDAATQEELKELENETRRAAGLTRQLLLFSRRSAKEARVLDLNSLVENLLKMLRRLIGEHIELAFAPIATSPTVEADAGMLEQVVMNLAVNARDAMPRGGRLTLALELINLDERQAQAQPEARAGEFVCLRVTDTGCGMDDATLKRVFEPFFTTKPAGQGTGLGLATVYSIAQQHQGWVSVQSQLLKGTTFRVYLPKATQPVATPLPLAQVALPAGRHETILVVEDESVVRRTVVQGLRLLGYRVLDAANGQEAVKLWQQHGTQVDLLFSDMVMPEGLTGLELAQLLRKKKPSLKVIIFSGYSSEITKAGLGVTPGALYLSKPFEMPLLARTVRDCLDSK